MELDSYHPKHGGMIDKKCLIDRTLQALLMIRISTNDHDKNSANFALNYCCCLRSSLGYLDAVVQSAQGAGEGSDRSAMGETQESVSDLWCAQVHISGRDTVHADVALEKGDRRKARSRVGFSGQGEFD